MPRFLHWLIFMRFPGPRHTSVATTHLQHGTSTARSTGRLPPPRRKQREQPLDRKALEHGSDHRHLRRRNSARAREAGGDWAQDSPEVHRPACSLPRTQVRSPIHCLVTKFAATWNLRVRRVLGKPFWFTLLWKSVVEVGMEIISLDWVKMPVCVGLNEQILNNEQSAYGL